MQECFDDCAQTTPTAWFWLYSWGNAGTYIGTGILVAEEDACNLIGVKFSPCKECTTFCAWSMITAALGFRFLIRNTQQKRERKVESSGEEEEEEKKASSDESSSSEAEAEEERRRRKRKQKRCA